MLLDRSNEHQRNGRKKIRRRAKHSSTMSPRGSKYREWDHRREVTGKQSPSNTACFHQTQRPDSIFMRSPMQISIEKINLWHQSIVPPNNSTFWRQNRNHKKIKDKHHKNPIEIDSWSILNQKLQENRSTYHPEPPADNGRRSGDQEPPGGQKKTASQGKFENCLSRKRDNLKPGFCLFDFLPNVSCSTKILLHYLKFTYLQTNISEVSNVQL